MDFIKLKNCMDKFIQEYNTPGLDCIVYHNHKMIFRYYTGMRDIENNKKVITYTAENYADKLAECIKYRNQGMAVELIPEK